MSFTVYAIATSEAQASSVVQTLKKEGFESDSISVLYPDTASTSRVDHDTAAPEGAIVGGTTGVVVGGALGWMAGIGALAIPGVGPFIAAGPILAALSGAILGATMGSLTGSLIGIGIPEADVQRYEGRIRNGGILISVHTGSIDGNAKVARILTKAGLEQVGISGSATSASSSGEPKKSKTVTVAAVKRAGAL